MVYSGTYYETVTVNKQLKLKGQDMPVINTLGMEDVITVTANGVTIDGFNAKTVGISYSGINVISNNNVIKNNNASNNKYEPPNKIIVKISTIFNMLILCSVLATLALTPVTGQVNSGSAKITIDHTKISSPLTNFPILIHLNKSSGENSVDFSAIFSELGTQYKKMNITTASGTELYGEVENWNYASKEAWIWVNVPSISSTSDTVLYLNYSSSWNDNTVHIGDIGSNAAENVWNSDYKNVMHMGENGNGTAGEYKDSTINHYDGTGNGVTGSPTQRLGFLGGSQYFDGINDYISIPDSNDFSWNPTHALTIEWWFIPTVTTWAKDSGTSEHYINMMGKGDYPDGWEYVFTLGGYTGLQTLKDQEIAFYTGLPTGGIQAGSGVFLDGRDPSKCNGLLDCGPRYNPGDRIYVVGRMDAQYIYVDTYYANGLKLTGQTDFTNYYGRDLSPSNTWSEFHIGTIPTQGQMFEGIIDEVRISNVYRSDTWLRASYYSGLDNLVSYSITILSPTPTPFITGVTITSTTPFAGNEINLTVTINNPGTSFNGRVEGNVWMPSGTAMYLGWENVVIPSGVSTVTIIGPAGGEESSYRTYNSGTYLYDVFLENVDQGQVYLNPTDSKKGVCIDTAVYQHCSR